ncbi:MAG TPA: hypothetical protein EYP77_08145, partial [Anaerolineae bacterium]|nr:hypothetical protein [Anaerolineae bacterium]
MSTFRNTEHLYQVLGTLFERLRENPQVAARLREGNLVVRFRFTDPEGVVTIDLTRHPIQYIFGETKLEPDVEMIQSADTAHLFWLGRLNIARAIATRRVIARGSVPKALALLPAIQPAHDIYPQVLLDLGYGDLVPAEKPRRKRKRRRWSLMFRRRRLSVDDYANLSRHFIPLTEVEPPAP